MDRNPIYRPRVSRETRWLLTTALVALAVLWVLASIRFPDRPAMPGPVQPLLTQLTPRPSFDELASDIADLRARLEPLVLALPVDPPAGVTGGGRARRALPALRVSDDVAVVLLDATSVRQTGDEYSVIARDLASGLAIVRVPAAPTPRPVLWSPQQMDRPRYLIATDTSTDVVSWHPVFVGSMRPVASPAWAAEVWRFPAHAELGPGSFVFARDALLVGLVVDHGGERALVSGETLIAEADRLLAQAATLPAHVGIEVQAMTPSISRATGAPAGVVVSWVDARGPAAGALDVGDVIESANGAPLPTEEHWNTLVTRLTADETITLAVRSGEAVREVQLVATLAPAPPETAPLGLTLRAVLGRGAEVVFVEAGAAADLAGLTIGDVMTRIGEIRAPSPAQVRQTFDDAPRERPVLIAFTRGATHHVSALEK